MQTCCWDSFHCSLLKAVVFYVNILCKWVSTVMAQNILQHLVITTTSLMRWGNIFHISHPNKLLLDYRYILQSVIFQHSATEGIQMHRIYTWHVLFCLNDSLTPMWDEREGFFFPRKMNENKLSVGFARMTLLTAYVYLFHWITSCYGR